MNTAKEIIALKLISFDGPLQRAREWTRSGDAAKRKEAVELLEGLRQRHPHVADIGHELALAQIECGCQEKAERVLKELLATHGPASEEVLCRWGRLYKDRGDYYVSFIDDVQDRDAAIAAHFYRMALEHYRRAYAVRKGHYPGINIASLHHVFNAIAAVEARNDNDRAESERFARELLDRRSTWPRESPDDFIWHMGTVAECNLLLQRWDQAAHYYKTAVSEANCQPFHIQSMSRQAKKNLHCFRRIGVMNAGPLEDLKAIFGEPCGQVE